MCFLVLYLSILQLLFRFQFQPCFFLLYLSILRLLLQFRFHVELCSYYYYSYYCLLYLSIQRLLLPFSATAPPRAFSIMDFLSALTPLAVFARAGFELFAWVIFYADVHRLEQF